MVTEGQVRRLMSLLQQEQSVRVAADKAGMDRKTARKYQRVGKLPSEVRTPRACGASSVSCPVIVYRLPSLIARG